MAEQSPLAQVREVVGTHLKLSRDDSMAVDFLLSIALSALRPGKRSPVWAWLVGPPGCGKTELMLPYRGHSAAFYVSELTPNSLVSGYETETGADPSLLPHLDGKLLMIEDFAPLVSMSADKVQEIMGTLRAVFDETYALASGTVGIRQHNARFGFVGAATPVLEVCLSVIQQLGERFLIFRMHRNDRALRDLASRIARLRHVYGAMGDKAKWRADLLVKVHKGLNNIRDRVLVEQVEDAPEEFLYPMLASADLVARLRSRPIKGTATDPEAANRIVQQLVGIGECRILADYRTKWTQADADFVQRVSVDTLPVAILAMTHALFHSSVPLSIDQLKARAYTSSNEYVISTLEQFLYMGVVEGSLTDGVMLGLETRQQIEASGILRYAPL